MSPSSFRNTVKTLAIIAVIAATATPANASTFSVTSSNNTFTVTRSDTNAAETVRCRAVSRSALAGLHFMGNIGRLDFADRSISYAASNYVSSAAFVEIQEEEHNGHQQ